MPIATKRSFSLLTPFCFKDKELERQFHAWKEPSVLLKIRAVSAVTGLLFIVYETLESGDDPLLFPPSHHFSVVICDLAITAKYQVTIMHEIFHIY